MRTSRFYFCCLAVTCFVVAAALPDKQIKLEDIEKDTLKAAQQAKQQQQQQQYQQQQYQQQQVQVQQQQQQQPQYQQAAYQYDPQVYAQQNVAYQAPASSYSQFLVPQQYYPQTVLSGYTPLSSNNLGTGYTSSSVNGFQTYLSPQLTSFQAGQPIAASTTTQPILVTFPSNSLSSFQQQPFYQGAVQYFPSQLFYTAGAADQLTTSQLTSNVVYPSTQQYIAPYQQVAATKGAAYPQQQYVSTAPQTFPSQGYSAQPEYTSIYTPNTYSSGSQQQVYTNTEQQNFVTVKTPQTVVASQGQQQQYIQANPTTISPLQAKYLNSPQYLAQNYNTIQSSQLYSKGALSSGVKSTVSPPLKAPAAGSYVSNNFAASSSSVSSYQPFRSLPTHKNY